MIGFGSNKMARALLRSMILALMWSVWMKRNARIFMDKEMKPQDIFEKTKYLAFLWVSTNKSFKEFSIVNNWKDVLGPQILQYLGGKSYFGLKLCHVF